MEYSKVSIKPLSVNQAWRGRRFKTDVYKAYEFELYHKLPNIKVSKDDKLRLHVIAGFSNKGSDLDNICKPFQDILQKRYGFNDSQIYQLVMIKEITTKGNEYIKFKIDTI